MKRIALIAGLSGLLVVLSTGPGHAQAPAVSDPAAPDQTIVEGAGVKVGEGTVLHPVVGAETGFISNVFYENTNIDSAPFLRLLVELNFASLSAQRLDSTDPNATPQDNGDLVYRAGLRFIGQEYLSSNDSVDAQHNIAGGANIHAIVFPHRTWKFGVDDDYIRDNRPTNFESPGNVNRDINSLMLQLKYEPAGTALSGALRYTNLVDVFETSTQAFANRIQHLIGLRANWQWLPITKVFADVSVGFFDPLGNSSTRNSSIPIRAVLGIQSAITTDTVVSLKAGYGEASYSMGTSASQPIVGVSVGWRYLPTGELTASYNYDFLDSIQANYFRDHAFEVTDTHQLDKFTMLTILDMRLRNYQFVNIPGVMAGDRSDVLLDFDLSPRYYIKDWFAATIDYDLIVDSTDFRYVTDGITVDPSYVRHQLMAGVRAAW